MHHGPMAVGVEFEGEIGGEGSVGDFVFGSQLGSQKPGPLAAQGSVGDDETLAQTNGQAVAGEALGGVEEDAVLVVTFILVFEIVVIEVQLQPAGGFVTDVGTDKPQVRLPREVAATVFEAGADGPAGGGILNFEI